MRFRIDPRDIPPPMAARRLGLDVVVFNAALPNLLARGFPRPDPDTGNFDLQAIDRWCNTRHPHLFTSAGPMGAVDVRTVADERLAAMRAANRG